MPLPYVDDPFANVRGGAGSSGGGVEDVGNLFYRKKANSGLYEMSVVDPDHPSRRIWVDAIYDAANDELIPLDSKYRDNSKRYSIANMFGMRFADSAETGIAPVVAAAGPSSSGIVLLGAALLALWLFTD